MKKILSVPFCFDCGARMTHVPGKIEIETLDIGAEVMVYCPEMHRFDYGSVFDADTLPKATAD